MKVEAYINNLVIPQDSLVFASDEPPAGYVRICVTVGGTGVDEFNLDIPKGVALVVRDEINRVLGPVVAFPSGAAERK